MTKSHQRSSAGNAVDVEAIRRWFNSLPGDSLCQTHWLALLDIISDPPQESTATVDADKLVVRDMDHRIVRGEVGERDLVWIEVTGPQLAAIRSALARTQPQATPLADVLASCKIEHTEFEKWAAAEKYDMHEHPLHYLFMDPKTNAARQGWKAALRYVASALSRPDRGVGK